ncbi:hypothetical protein IAR55_000871 [Kwoniella newhampshirensis]|uniref:Uncharacterized protein n=1 Tax=Kwoniella newhampshirensis TaxID=1651941 RepID=A0AAW0Z456_9TREE
MTPKVSPLPTPGEDGATGPGGLTTSLSTSNITTPLSSFVSNWTKGVSPGTPQAQPSSSTSGMPPNNRKLSVTNFFSRGAAGRKEDKKDKDLPNPPGSGNEAELEPSPEIEGEHMESKRDEDRRKSHGTTVTDLEEELGTPQGSAREVIEEEEAATAEGVGKGNNGEKLEEVSI